MIKTLVKMNSVIIDNVIVSELVCGGIRICPIRLFCKMRGIEKEQLEIEFPRFTYGNKIEDARLVSILCSEGMPRFKEIIDAMMDETNYVLK